MYLMYFYILFIYNIYILLYNTILYFLSYININIKILYNILLKLIKIIII